MAESPSWTSWPLSEWNMSAPTEKMSLCASTSELRPAACSGAMYDAVPITMPSPLALGFRAAS